ncbi:MAG: RsiV family protein, partial [Pseudomonadota bacterium]|nr:RsiV family protein [Pseudomonadota bacterium]
DTFWALARDAHTQWLDQQKLDQNFRDSWPFDQTDQAYFSEQGLVLLYNVYHIAPYAMGQPELTLRYDALEGVIRDTYLP